MHHQPPQAVDEKTSAAGLRAIAIFEAVKGTGVILLALGLLTLLHRDVEDAVESLLVHLHLNTDHRVARVILKAASGVTDARIWGIAGAALAYSTVRFVEAWGLWHKRVWAEWFALLSGGLYLPWEIMKVAEQPNFFHVGLLAGNLVIVLYMLYVRVRAFNRAEGESELPLRS